MYYKKAVFISVCECQSLSFYQSNHWFGADLIWNEKKIQMFTTCQNYYLDMFWTIHLDDVFW